MYTRELNSEEQDQLNHEQAPSKATKQIKQKAKSDGLKYLESSQVEKLLHGQYPPRAYNFDVDQNKSHQRLRCSELKAETEGFILPAQDQHLLTRSYQFRVMKSEPDIICRTHNIRKSFPILTLGCPTIAPNENL